MWGSTWLRRRASAQHLTARVPFDSRRPELERAEWMTQRSVSFYLLRLVPLALTALSCKQLSAQGIGEECTAIVSGLPRLDSSILPPDDVDEPTLAALIPYLDGREVRGDAWPGPALLDSLARVDSAALLGTLVFVVGDNRYFSQLQQDAAANAYRRLDGPAEPLLERMRRPASDVAWTALISALPRTLTPADEAALLRQACLLGVLVDAVGPLFPTMEATEAQSGPPSVFRRWIWDLERIRERLTETRAKDFDRVLLPVILRNKFRPIYWQQVSPSD